MEDQKFIFHLMVNGKKSIREFVLTSPVPVEVAAKLSKTYELMALDEKERAKELTAMSDYCEEMATDLTGVAATICHGAEALLNAVDAHHVSFLDILVDCDQKEVIAQPIVQQYVSEIWKGHISHWSSLKVIGLFLVLLLVPPVWIVVSLPIRHRFFRLPLIKFMCHLVSHLYFIALFLVCVVFPPVSIWDSADLIPHWYEWTLILWLAGHVVSQLTDAEDRKGLGWLKVIVIGVCSIGVCVHLVGFAFEDDDRLECIYVRNQFFALALLLCFVQLMEFLSFHHLFGPWAIIIGEIMKDLLRFIVVLAVFLLGFAFNLAAIYIPVSEPYPTGIGDGDGSGGAAMRTAQGTFELLYFAIFGMVDPENMPPLNNHPWWSYYLLKSVLGVYMLISFIMLVNLLIAMMTDTYCDIQAESDVEWKFGRCKQFRNMTKTASTPSPVNLFTKVFAYLTILLKHRGASCKLDIRALVDQEEGLDFETQQKMVDEEIGKTGLSYDDKEHPTGVSSIQTGPVQLEKIVDWKVVIEKYLALQE